MLHMPQVELIQKASCGYYLEGITASSSSCLILKHTKLQVLIKHFLTPQTRLY